MFRVESEESGRGYRLAIAGLVVLSVAAFFVTVWVMVDFLREQEIVHALIGQLPPEAALAAEELEGELRWQFRLSTLIVLNLVVTALAMALLWRAYGTSQASLRDIKAKAGDIGSSIQLRDVTERVLMDDRLRRMERYMGLGSLAAGLHHEIKNPLAALSLHVQLLEEELDDSEVTDDVLQMLSVIKTEVTRIGGVLENFRDFASIARLNTGTVDLVTLIERQVRLITPQAGGQNIEIHVDCEDDLPSIDSDRVRLEQVLLNLLVNAMEAMPDGGTLTVRASRKDSSDGESVSIRVVDSSPGIAESIRDRIFDPYFTTKSEGTGMGLALCDKIIRQHDGSLEFHLSDSGTVFEMTLWGCSSSLTMARFATISTTASTSSRFSYRRCGNVAKTVLVHGLPEFPVVAYSSETPRDLSDD